MSMLEKVAHAIDNVMFVPGVNTFGSSMNAARAALEAMQEPNVEMYRAAFDALVPSADAEACWKAMIGAALNEGRAA